ncbi:MAG: SLBB domain-containing protein [Gemmatimonadota bacterium]
MKCFSGVVARARVIAVSMLVLAAPIVGAQTPLPSPDQARRILETRPDLVAQVRRELASSGLTPDQIRARLRNAGYPENLLDAYVRPLRTGGDSTAATTASVEVLDAIAALGIADSGDTAELRQLLKGRRPLASDAAVAGRDSALDLTLSDSAETIVDSLGRPIRGARVLSATRRPVVDSGFTIFGANVFDGATTQFDANLTGPVDASYRLGAGDRIVLIITGDAERTFTLDVTREGFIVVPGVGEIAVANLTLGQLEDILYPRLGRVFSGLHRGAGATTHFSLNLARLHTNQVVVLGDVVQPGSYRVSSAGTALTALYAAGGPRRTGSMRRVEIRRGNKLVDTLDLYDYLLRADASHDPRLQSGDVIFVPVHGPRVRLHGEVVRPATYELRRGETLADAIRAAGGFTANAVRRRVQISRVLPPAQRDTTDRARVIIDIASDQFTSGFGPAYPMEPGDVIQVFAVSSRVGRRVAVNGNVWSPGSVGLTPGMRLSDAVRLAGGIKPDAFLGQVLVSRLRASDSTRVQLRTSFADSSGRITDDFLLREDDEIRVFSVTELRPVSYLAITGAVRKPGRFTFREGMTIRDAILLAGGLTESADVGEAEIARLPVSRDGGRLAETVRVRLDSSYLMPLSGDNVSTPSRALAARPEVMLRPFDNVLILAQPDWAPPRRVALTGEVRYPGTYTLTGKQDRLSDLLARAGGLTQSAYPNGVAFYRRTGRVGRVGIDLAQVIRDATFRDNLVLQDGDSIHLPQFTAIVEVQGAVNAPRGVAYVPGADLLYYVRAAGGPSRSAEISRSYVTQPDGTVESLVTRTLRPDDVPVPRAGATVMVTEKDPTEHPDTIARLGVIAQIIGGLVTLVAILYRP